MKLYYPERTNQIDYVGYNNAIRLILKALPDLFTNNPAEASFRFYSNIPRPPSIKELKKSGLPIIYYTMYETTRLPKLWVKFLNKHVDIVAVPSEFCKNVFIASGVKKPIGILSLGVAVDEIPEVAKKPRTNEYVFMWQGVTVDGKGSHKGADSIWETFKELKRDGLLPNATLIVKTRLVNSIMNPSIEIKDFTFSFGIRIIQTDLSRDKLNALYKTVDCCINTTRGEGFGLIPLEQMAMGKPVIVTDWSMPYIDDRYCLPLKRKIVDSPMWWNHRHLRISKSAISYNFTGIQKIKCLLPHIGMRLADGHRVKSFPETNLSLIDKLKAKIYNMFIFIQEKTGLYFKKSDKSIRIYQEYPGKDAQIDLADLKEKMIWCYNNRAKAEKIGASAREYVLRNWTLARIRKDFDKNIIPLINQWRKDHGTKRD